MRVLVTGNEGYIGCILVPLLQRAGHEVTGLDVGLFHECALSEIARPPTLRKDVRDVELSDLHGFDAVIHLAGLANDPLGDLDPPLTFEINHQASVRLGELAKRAGVRRFLYASTCSVYGASGDNSITEEMPLNPLTAYAESKTRAEADLIRLAGPGFCLVFLRAATAYGVSPYLRFDLALNNLAAWACTTGLVYLKSDGRAWRPLVHVEDIATAYRVLLEAPEERVHRQVFNVGATEENYRIGDLAELVRRNVPNSRVQYADDCFPDFRSYHVSCDKLRQAGFGYATKWTAEAGICEVRDAVMRERLGAEDFEGPRYNRIAHLRQLLNEGRVDSSLRWTATEVPELLRARSA